MFVCVEFFFRKLRKILILLLLGKNALLGLLKNMICFSVNNFRPSSAFDHLALKWSTKVHIIALNTLKKKSSIALNMPQTSQEQMAAANMDSYMDRNVFNLLKDETGEVAILFVCYI